MGIMEQFNIDGLLKPYKEGGIESSPIERSISTIASKLIISNRIPSEVVGAAIFKVFHNMAYEGLEFKGDGSYGSKGRELFSCIKAQAIDMIKKESADRVVNDIMNMTACVKSNCSQRGRTLEKMSLWHRLKLWIMQPRGPLWRL